MAEPLTYRKKPVEVQAMLFDGDTADLHNVYLWVERHIGSIESYAQQPGLAIDPADGMLVIRTLEGDMKAQRGDWIIRGVQGEVYPCKPEIFAATYELVD